MIDRKRYLDKLISKKENGLVKIITGIRRCGKSYLLFNIYKNYLKSIGVAEYIAPKLTPRPLKLNSGVGEVEQWRRRS